MATDNQETLFNAQATEEINMKSETLYQPEQKRPHSEPDDNSLKVTADNKGIHVDITWQKIQQLTKPIVSRILPYLITAGLTWLATAHPPLPSSPNSPPIACPSTQFIK